MIGNPAYVPTDEDRANVRAWIQVTEADTIANYMGISRDTLDRHYPDELKTGRFLLVAKLGGMAVKMALAGDRTMLIFCLRTLGKWNTRVEVTGPGGGPVRFTDISSILETYTDDQLALVEPLLERILASGATPGVPGIDPGGFVGAPAVEGGKEPAGA
jgi:hypothetical protein